MPDQCTCGAVLVEDARFCHRCARPTRDEPVGEAASHAAAPQPAAPTAAQRLAKLPVSFANPIALRIAFMLSMMVLLAQNIPVLQLLFVVWWLAAGWVGVLWYRRLTGSLLSVRAGARLGVITGVMIFVAILVNLAITFMVAGTQEFQQTMREQMMKSDPRTAQMMAEPTAIVLVMLLGLAFSFVVVVGVCAAGGALAARFTPRRANG